MAHLETTGITILIGIFIYVVGQLLSKFLIDPAYELLKAIGEVRFNLAFHAATIHTPEARSKNAAEKARDALMKSSSDLIAKLHAIPPYGKLWFLFRLPPCQAIEEAAVTLRGLSTYVYEYVDEREQKSKTLDAIQKRVKRIERLLRFKPLESIGYPMEPSN